jgi:hypothetical protein
MAIITSRTQLSQGASTTESVDFTASSGTQTTLTGSGLPTVGAGDFFEIRNSPITGNNGLYVASGTPTASSVTCDKVNGANPTNDTTESVQWLGDTTTYKSVFFDTAGLGIYLLEQGNLSVDGVTGQAVYSFAMQEWKDDSFLIANAPFPMLTIDSDAGKFIIGQDISGNNNGFNWVDDVGNSIRTRKLLRNAGWDEVDANGNTTARYVGVVTLGSFEAPTTDIAYYQFGNDTTVDDTVDFDFAGPVNEAVPFFTRLANGSINGGTGVAISTDGRTLTRSDGGNWRTDGFIVGGQITLRDSEDSTMDGTWRLTSVGAGVDGAITCGIGAQATATTGFDFNDNGGSEDTLDRNDGGSFLLDGWVVGSKIIVTGATAAGNNGTYTVTAVTAGTMNVATGSFDVANTQDDNTAVIGMFDDALTPDTTINAAVNNDNIMTLRLRIRDADPEGKTFSQANLASAGKTVLGNFVYAFPLANSTDLKITATDSTITTSTPYVAAEDSNNTDGSVTAGSAVFTSAAAPFAGGAGDVGKLITIQSGTNIGMYEIVTFGTTTTATVDRAFANTESSITYQLRDQGMSVEYFSTPQARTDLVGGSVNFGIIVTGNNGTAEQVFEFLQYKLRTLGDIDSGAEIAVGRTMDGLARFVGDTGEFGSTDGGLTFPTNPDGGGSGVYVDGLNALSKNSVVFYDNLGNPKTFPETIAVTLDFNQIAIDDTTTEYDLFYDRTIRTPQATLTDLVIGTAGGGQFTSSGGDLPNNAQLGVGSYVRVGGLTGGDAPMNGVYQVVAETTPGSDWTVTRYDGVTIVAVSATAADIDQNCIDTPDAILVHTNVRTAFYSRYVYSN